MSADDARTAILSRHAQTPATESPSERRRRKTRERMRALRERRAAAQEAVRAEHAEDEERDAVVQRATPSRVDEPVRRSGDGKLLGVIRGALQPGAEYISFRRDAQGLPDYEAWLAMPTEEPERPATLTLPSGRYSFFTTDEHDISRVATIAAEELSFDERDVRRTLSCVLPGRTCTLGPLDGLQPSSV